MPPPIPRCSSGAYSSLNSPSHFSLPRYGSRVGLHIVLFEACSAFTRVAACTLALSPRRLLQSHHLRYGIAPIATLRNVFCVAEALHERRPRFRNANGIPSRRRRFAREAVARQRWNHEMECICRGPAVRRRIRQLSDDLHLLDDLAGPAMRDDHRQRIFMLRANVNEMNVEPVDLGDEVRHSTVSLS